MRAVIHPGIPRGQTEAPPSKSMAHRLLICAGFAEGESVIRHVDASEDILATADCLRALGAEVRIEEGTVFIRGCDPRKAGEAMLACRESGSTLRFMIPAALLCGKEIRFDGSERLMSRPLTVYEEICAERGMIFARENGGLRVHGTLTAGTYTVRGDISSQFISGLMFALPLTGTDSRIEILPPLESRSYLDLTMQALRDSGIEAEWDGEYALKIPAGTYRAREATVEGDYSNAAYLDILNDAGGEVELTGLRADSLQGDRVYSRYLAEIRKGTPELDVTDCPDLAPALIAAAALHNGAKLTGTRRLRLKESVRGEAMREEMAKFGVILENKENEILIPGQTPETPAEPLDSHNDHRIVMALAAVCVKTGGVLDGAEAVRKSLPDYWDRLAGLGIQAEVEPWSGSAGKIS
ncbi:MAG: 3-phosphoshikimate 1-carboxyvinyltransferase [Clostridia bacterium]|nr:3-phosphoshikimate 1-carboxyvinyltransferase [Clostridia bacterium]